MTTLDEVGLLSSPMQLWERRLGHPLLTVSMLVMEGTGEEDLNNTWESLKTRTEIKFRRHRSSLANAEAFNTLIVIMRSGLCLLGILQQPTMKGK